MIGSHIYKMSLNVDKTMRLLYLLKWIYFSPLAMPENTVSVGYAEIGILKTTFRFNNSLEALQNSLDAVILTIMVYYSKSYSLKLAKGRDAWGRVQENSKAST